MQNLNPKVSWTILIVISLSFFIYLNIVYYQTYSSSILAKIKSTSSTPTSNTSISTIPTKSSTPTTSTIPSPTVTLSETNPDTGWKTYTSKDYGFSISCPGDIVMYNDTDPNHKSIYLGISAQKLNDVYDNFSYDRETVMTDKDLVQKGDPSTHFRWSVEGSNKILDISGAVGKEYTSLGGVETAEIHFYRNANIYHNEDFIEIVVGYSWSVESKIVKENPDYFMQDNPEYPDSLVWKDYSNGEERFYNDLVAGKTGPFSQLWYKGFDKIIATLKFN